MSASLLSLHCLSFGVSFLLSADSGALLAQMRECAPHATEFNTPPHSDAAQFALLKSSTGYRLIVGDVSIDDAGLEPLLDQLACDLMVHVANHAPDYVFMHAGVVAWQGRAVLLPGTSFAGKTTLVAELVGAGAIYYSDEYAVLDDRGRVHPYARDLQIRTEGSSEQRSVPVSQLNGRTGIDPLPVSLVVFTEYVEGSEWRTEPVSPGMAALEMLRHTIPVQRIPARVMAALARVMETATALRSPRGEARDAASCILLAMDGALRT